MAPKGAWGAADGPRLFQRLTDSYGYLTQQAQPHVFLLACPAVACRHYAARTTVKIQKHACVSQSERDVMGHLLCARLYYMSGIGIV